MLLDFGRISRSWQDVSVDVGASIWHDRGVDKTKNWLAGYQHGRGAAEKILSADLGKYNPGSTVAGGLSFRARRIPPGMKERREYMHAFAEGWLDHLRQEEAET